MADHRDVLGDALAPVAQDVLGGPSELVGGADDRIEVGVLLEQPVREGPASVQLPDANSSEEGETWRTSVVTTPKHVATRLLDAA